MTGKPKPFLPYLWLRSRGDAEAIWYIVYPGPAPAFEQTHETTRLRAADEAKARKVLKRFIERRAREALVVGTSDDGPLTVRRLADLWLTRRKQKRISTVGDYESKLRIHILPVIGDMRADQVRIEDIERVMAEVASKGLANKTQLRVYETMHAMFGWAVPRLLETSPCGIKGEDLPADVYSKPNFQAEAEFTLAEVVAILTAEIIPVDRRIFYAVMFLAGMRVGEVSALRVCDYQREVTPLGKLLVGRSYNTKLRMVKSTKTDVDRVVPVHPELARLLIWWLEVGWEQMMGRPPGPSDVLVPSRKGNHRDSSTTWKQLNGERHKDGRPPQLGDLDRLGLRRRRVHDTRHTFVTLMLDDGARPDLIQYITHGPGKKIIAQYTAHPPWKALCAEVLKLQIDLSKSAKPGDQGQVKVSTEVSMSEIINGLQALTERPQRDSNQRRPHGQRRTDDDSHGQVAPPLRIGLRKHAPSEVTTGQPRTTDTLDTFALRRVLVALDRGRLDQAREILVQLIKQETDVRAVAR